MIVDEPHLRREDFRPGWRVLGADKQVWHVAPITLLDAMKLRALRAYIRLVERHPDLAFRWHVERAAALEILRQNYNIRDDQVDRILGDPFSLPDRPDDPNRAVTYCVLEAAALTLRESHPFVRPALRTPHFVN